MYFPELAHATTEEKTLADGTVEITFRKQVARKGTGNEMNNQLSLLLTELEAVPPYDDPLAELMATIGTEPVSLAGLLEVHETLRVHASDVYELRGRAAQVVKRCLTLPPSPIKDLALGF